MKTIVKTLKWGNSLGIRINKSFQQELLISENSEFVLELDNGRLIATPVRAKKSLDELLSKVDKSNLHKEIDFGKKKGKELW